ncbi:MAG: hypothetical protein CLLPBCKN_004459 [Chroococcidiopsis cubana SAG 39.79]|nr:hypothetical protein [Chroococcidiopsis cubana SAG 39.79]
MNVREVWFWQNENFFLYHLREETPSQFQQTFGYERIDRSEILPSLDINLLAECLTNSNPLAAAKDFRQRLRSQFSKIQFNLIMRALLILYLNLTINTYYFDF